VPTFMDVLIAHGKVDRRTLSELPIPSTLQQKAGEAPGWTSVAAA
jgi:hypothetical protein